MLRILLADDEPLVLIGLQGMLEWEKLGYTVCGTARNGRIAQELIEREQPDIVIADVKMPVMDGLDLARACHEKGPLPVFIMLTSSEDFSYARRAIEAGVVDYLVKMDLTPKSLCDALARAAEQVNKERALNDTARTPSRTEMEAGLRTMQDRFLIRLYTGLIPDEEHLRQEMKGLELQLDGCLVAACCEILPSNPGMTSDQQLKLNLACCQMLETTLGNYLPAHATGTDVLHFNVLFALPEEPAGGLKALLEPLLKKASQIVYNYFSARLLWAVGRPVQDPLSLSRRCRELDTIRVLLSEAEPILFAVDLESDATASKLQTVAQVKAYIREHLSEKLTLADVADVFNFSPGYLSQLFGRYGGGFVEYITEVRVAAAKEMLEKGDKKIYEIAEELGFESSFYFSKVFKKSTGLSPREYQQK